MIWKQCIFFLNNTLFYPLFLYSHYMTLLYKVFSFKTTHSVFTLQLEKVILIFQQEGIRYSQTIAGIYYALFFRSPFLLQSDHFLKIAL